VKRFIFFISFLLVVVSCAPPAHREKKVTPPLPEVTYAPPKEPYIYQEGKAAFDRDNLTEALEKLNRFIELNPASDLTDDALFLEGQIFLKRENPYEALRFFQRIEDEFPGSNTFGEALYGEAFCLYRLKEFDRSREKLEKLLRLPLPDPLYIRAQTLRGHLCVMKGEIPCGIKHYLAARAKTTNPTEQGVLDAFITKVIFKIEDKGILEDLIRQHPGGMVGQAAKVRLAELLIEQEKYKEAESLLPPSFVEKLPENLKRKSQELLGMLKHAFIKKVKIGCLLPLSGKRAHFGLRALKGALIAANTFDPNPKDIEVTLIVKDTGGRPETSAKEARELVEIDHVLAIIGPMFLNTTKAAASAIQSAPVPLISLSQADGVPQLGAFVFRNCLTSTQQIRALVRFLINGLNARRAAILYPSIPFGKRYMKLFWETFTENGGEIRGAESYLPTDTDFAVPIKKLTGLYHTKERWGRGDTPSEEDGKFKPVIDFEVLFIPDTYKRVVLIAPQLAFYDVVGITLVGVNTWNAPELIREGKRYVQGAIFPDGFSPKSDSPFVKVFVKSFDAAFGEVPEILAAQAYDAVRLLAILLQRFPVTNTDELEEKLRVDTNFHGVSGLRYYDDVGEAVRDVLILAVTKKGIVPLLPEKPSNPDSDSP
jgi:ABC-type branched-subunit amino acid transport system substrate-binding protein